MGTQWQGILRKPISDSSEFCPIQFYRPLLFFLFLPPFLFLPLQITRKDELDRIILLKEFKQTTCQNLDILNLQNTNNYTHHTDVVCRF